MHKIDRLHRGKSAKYVKKLRELSTVMVGGIDFPLFLAYDFFYFGILTCYRRLVMPPVPLPMAGNNLRL